MQEECQETAKCAPFAKHFAHCEEKVNAGQGFKGEDCVEELYVSILSLFCFSVLTYLLSCE